MMYVNYNGLTYMWNYGHTVSVLDNGTEVDAFSVGCFGTDNIFYAQFLAGVVSWDQYAREAANYSSEEMLW